MRKLILGAALLCGAALALFATRTLWLPPQTVTVVLAEQSPYWLPFYLARAEGWFRREGLDVRVVVAADREDLLDAVSREPDIALAQPDVILNRPDSPVMFARVAGRDPTFLLGRQQPGRAFRWSDLAGRTIVGCPPGSEAQAVLEAALKKEGVDAQWRATVLENIPPPLRVPAFLAGTGQYLQVGEPAASRLEQEHQAVVLAFPGAVTGDLPAGVFLASGATLQSRPRVLAAFTRAVCRSLAWLQHNPAGSAQSEVAGYFPGVDPAVLTAALDRYQAAGVWPATPVISRDSFERWTKLMVEAGELARPPSFAEAVDPVPAREAVRTAGMSPYRRWIWPVLGD